MKYNRNIYSSRAAAMRAREFEMEQRERRKTNGILIGSIALVLVACIAAGVFVYGAFAIQKANSDPAPTTAVSQAADNNTALLANNTASDQQTSVQTAQAGSTSGQNIQNTDDPNIKIINGDRVYIDTKHPAPANNGTPLHFTNAYGKTSYGFDWTYNADNSNVSIACNYNFSKQQYDFIIYGAAPGTTHLTLYYNTDDNTQAPVQLTVNVDNNLNATQG